MNRTLRISARPFIALGVTFGVVTLIFVVVGFVKGRPDTGLKTVEFFVGLYILVMVMICSMRITVTDDRIVIARYFIPMRSIRFEYIHHSDVQFLAEGDWPFSISIHSGRRQPPITLDLKSIRKEDAAWLCSLPQLKCRTHPGLTHVAESPPGGPS